MDPVKKNCDYYPVMVVYNQKNKQKKLSFLQGGFSVMRLRIILPKKYSGVCKVATAIIPTIFQPKKKKKVVTLWDLAPSGFHFLLQ